jgi:hypothetical protein
LGPEQEIAVAQVATVELDPKLERRERAGRAPGLGARVVRSLQILADIGMNEVAQQPDAGGLDEPGLAPGAARRPDVHVAHLGPSPAGREIGCITADAERPGDVVGRPGGEDGHGDVTPGQRLHRSAHRAVAAGHRDHVTRVA